MRINHNIAALNTHRQLGTANNAQMKSMEKLSSGLRINRAGDDAAGLSVSEKMRSQIRGLDQASRNSQDGISFLQTAEGALNEVSAMATRLKELAVQKENGTYNEEDITNIDLEMTSLTEEINNIFDTTEFNTKNVFDTEVDITVTQDASVKMTIAAATLDLTKALTSESTVAEIDAAIDEINLQRATYGSQQNRLEHTINNLNTTNENLTASESRIRDVDMAKEMMEQTKNSILAQASQAMLAQSNQMPQGVLQLLR
ncbi:flagellin N-terminal helical domain-containing protein [Sutcliffiella rhizosphaerae]|uniref:Flagellin n=1 Tax=Sutcliffiella rhizosphaerae TaxID=2880967 RepID=A0ABM8YNK4_9BACI|nr:flagellin [Sutcliffiella rhizosphaerae]CAG9621438.1 Flagellin [Sutcliffiella rhizosphaerae]